MAWLASTAGVLLGSITSCKPATGAAGKEVTQSCESETV
jgi:hypothetical protein